MIKNTLTIAGIALITSGAWAIGPSGGAYSIPWSTIDSGGVINSSGGSFVLSGTIGQPDAGPTMTGGSFSLTGGFWAGVNSGPPCPADLNGDGELDFLDISAFLAAYSGQLPAADLNGDMQWDFLDISAFLASYSSGCP